MGRLRNINDVNHHNRKESGGIKEEENHCDRLTELNGQEQILNLVKTSIIQRGWQHEQKADLHGWVYGLMIFDWYAFKGEYDHLPESSNELQYR